MKIDANKKHKGFLFTFEGPDGCGKSSVVQLVYRYLQKKYPGKVVRTREPGGTNNPIAEDIRNIILNKLDYKIIPTTEALLFAASRAQHVHDYIVPNLKMNNIVLCDRFVHSSLIYQGVARGLGFDEVKKINDPALAGLWPDIVFVLMVNPSVGMKRILANKEREYNRLDREAMSMHKKVYKGYKDMIKKYPKGLVVIDASKPLDKVVKDVIKVLNKKLTTYGK